MVQMKHSNLSHCFTQGSLWPTRKVGSDGPQDFIRKTRRGSTWDSFCPICLRYFFSEIRNASSYFLQTHLSIFRAPVQSSVAAPQTLQHKAPITDDNQHQAQLSSCFTSQTSPKHIPPPPQSLPQRAGGAFQRSPVPSLARGTCVIPERCLSWGF